ncbi:MAG: GntR family transcriptional regulator [Spirochaetales bacterium]|nr:GntR family transcriptional regulator [Spirochaetales bacterium]
MSDREVLSLKEKAYEIIKRKILNCELQPGDVIDKNVLIEELGVGRTPIREALSNLEQENLVVIMPRRGVVVSNISINELGQIYTVREIIEPAMIRLALPNIGEGELNEFRELFNSYIQMDILEQTTADSRFHQFLASKTENSYIIRLMDNLHSQNQRLRIITSKVPDRMRNSSEEHLQIIEKLMTKDADGAEALMRKHIAISKKAAFSVL